MVEGAIDLIINAVVPGEVVKQLPIAEEEQRPLKQLGGEQTRTPEADNPYEEMFAFQMLELIREGKLPLEAVPLYFQKLRAEELDRATGAIYKRQLPINSVEHRYWTRITGEHTKILAKEYSDPQKIANNVAKIEGKYSRLMTNRQEQARYFANEAIELSVYPHWRTVEETTRSNTWAANLYSMASQLAKEVVVEQKIPIEKTPQ